MAVDCAVIVAHLAGLLGSPSDRFRPPSPAGLEPAGLEPAGLEPAGRARVRQPVRRSAQPVRRSRAEPWRRSGARHTGPPGA